MEKKKLVRVYLASPYTHKDKAVVLDRYLRTVLATATLQMAHLECNIFSPILNSHPLADLGGMRGDWAFWKGLDIDHIESCHEIWVYTISGWRESVGVTEEIEIGRALGMPIKYLDSELNLHNEPQDII